METLALLVLIASMDAVHMKYFIKHIKNHPHNNYLHGVGSIIYGIQNAKVRVCSCLAPVNTEHNLTIRFSDHANRGTTVEEHQERRKF